jgi:hypothetical protein
LSLDDMVEEPVLNKDLEAELRVNEIVMEDERVMREKGTRRETTTATGKASLYTPTRTDKGNQANLPAMNVQGDCLHKIVHPALSVEMTIVHWRMGVDTRLVGDF